MAVSRNPAAHRSRSRRPGARGSLDPRYRQTGFERASAMHRLADGRLAATLDEAWWAPAGPSGGYLAAIIVRALETERALSEGRQLRSLAVHFLKPPVAGTMHLEVRVLRAGRRLARSWVTAEQDGQPVLAAIASLAAEDLPMARSWQEPAPAVPDAPRRRAPTVPRSRYRDDGSHWLQLPAELPPVIHRAKLAPQFGHGRLSGQSPSAGRGPETGGWMMLGERQPVDAALLALYTDLWWPASLEPLRAPARAPTIELVIHFRSAPPPGGLADQPILAHFRSRAASEGLVDEDGALYLADGTLLAQSRQLSLLTPA